MRTLVLLVAVAVAPLALPAAAAASTCQQPTSIFRACADTESPSASWDSTPVFPPSPLPIIGVWFHAKGSADGANATTRDGAHSLWLDGEHGAARVCARSIGTVVYHDCLDAHDPSTFPSPPTDPQPYVDSVGRTVDSVLDDPLLQCLPRICPIPV